MLVKTRAIVISSLKYQEKSLIVKCLTLSDGLKSYFVRDAFSAKKASKSFGTRISYFQPLTILEIEASHKNKGTLENFKEIKISQSLETVHSNIYKSTIVMFVSEILHHSIKEEQVDEQLFTFLEASIYWLDNNSGFANFHLVLMLETSKYLGFYPDLSDIDQQYFDLTEGRFSPFLATSSLTAHETNLFKKLIGLKFDDNLKTFHVTERQILLKILIDYYATHLDGFKRPKSLEILKEIFS